MFNVVVHVPENRKPYVVWNLIFKNPDYYFFIKLKYSVLQNGGRRALIVWYGMVRSTTLCDLPQVSGFLRVLRFPPPIKLTATL